MGVQLRNESNSIFKLTDVLPDKSLREKKPHIKSTDKSCVSRNFTDLRYINKLFTPTFASSEAKK